MKIDLEELLAAPSGPSSPTFQATPTMTPTRVRGGSWKNMTATRGPYQKRHRRLREWARRRPLRSNKLPYTSGRPGHPEQDDYFNQPDEPRSEFATPPSKRDDQDPFQDSPSPQPPPSTPQRPLPRPVLSPPLSTRSAPGRLEPSRTADLISSSEDVDDKIIERLRKCLTRSELKNEKVGNNYLFEVIPAGEPDRKIMKIGQTKGTERLRMKQIKSQCKPFSMEREVDAQGMPILLFDKAEKLMQAELDDRIYRFACACGKKHREYFDVDTTAAQAVIRGWRAFCELDPYDASGKLRPFWEHRLRRRKALRHWGDRTPDDLSELKSRRLRWEVFANPTQYEILWFRITFSVSKAWPWRLHIISVFEALVIGVFISPPSYLSWIWILILLICLFKE
ncbi:hypothetical protein F5Y12DRAFT_714275 [Xylaria sp. FL1777]|nr:hypothetical protein F5Y12DRAFT_714275 [Xylaria sp. FL1777]